MSRAASLDGSIGPTGHSSAAAVWLAAGVAVLGAALLRFFDPSAVALVPPCPFHVLTGLYCPGCGSMRALHQALQGHLGAALGFNLLAVLLFPVLVCHLALRILGAVCRRDLAGPLDSRYSGRIALIAVLAFWVMRNIPDYPLSALAP